MFGNVKMMATKGAFNLYETASGLHVMVFVTKGLQTVIHLGKTSRSYVAYIPASVSADENIDLADFFSKLFADVYPKHPIKSYTASNVTPAMSTDDVQIVQFIDSIGAKAPDAITDKLLTDAGYNIAGLKKSLTSSVERDYSDLLLKEDAREAFNLIGDRIALICPTVATLSDEMRLAYSAIKSGRISSVFLVGPAGTGKTVQTYILSHLMGAPLLTFQATSGMVVEDMKGQFIPSEDSAKQFEFCMGLLLKAYTQGWQMVIDEVNMAPADVMSVLNQFMDSTPSVTINDTVYKKHPNFVLYMTMNAGYEGTNTLNPALKSRGLVLSIDRLTREVFVSRMRGYCKENFSSELSVSFYDTLFSFQNYIQTLSKQYAEDIEVCIRNAQHLTSLVLTAPCTKDTFEFAVSSSYTNYLCMDNDNTQKLEGVKQSEEYKKYVDTLYSRYTFKESVTITENELAEYADCVNNEFDDAALNSGTIDEELEAAIETFSDIEAEAKGVIEDLLAD